MKSYQLKSSNHDKTPIVQIPKTLADRYNTGCTTLKAFVRYHA